MSFPCFFIFADRASQYIYLNINQLDALKCYNEFVSCGDRKSKRLQMNVKFSTIVTGHGTLRAYYHRFKIMEDPICVCKTGPQTTDHLIRECVKLRKQRETLKNRIRKAGRVWPISNFDLANKHTK